MTDHLKLSRIAKALTDGSNSASSFDAAEARLNAVHVAVLLGTTQAASAAGQAAALTAVNASFKCFGAVTLVIQQPTSLLNSLPIGNDLHCAARTLGAVVSTEIPRDATHIIDISDESTRDVPAFVRCWWNGWTAGVVPPWDFRPMGDAGNPLAGIFAGALAVREVFATVLAYPRSGVRVSVTSLWETPSDSLIDSTGPKTAYIAARLWLIGMGHLGQGILWSLGLLPVTGIEVVMQDDQNAGEENEATGLLTRGYFIGRRKTRIAADWLDRPGWTTRLIERRHYGDIPLLDNDPTVVITSLDEPTARIKIARAGFDYLIDAGIGHGPVDFEALQIRILAKGADPLAFWSSPEAPKDLGKLLMRDAYRSQSSQSGECGALTLANASVAVPFVGAAIGALTIASVMRLASMQTTPKIVQMELGAPSMAVMGGENPAPSESRGTIEVTLGS